MDAIRLTSEHVPHPDKLKVPFYCWQCLSLSTTSRTIDFVIEDEVAMFAFINLLQHRRGEIWNKHIEIKETQEFKKKKIPRQGLTKQEYELLKLKLKKRMERRIVALKIKPLPISMVCAFD